MSYKIPIYNADGKQVDTLTLDDKIFWSTVTPDVMHEYVLMQNNNARTSNAHTKTRAEVSWSGKKLYKQKKTGNARTWDRRSPIRKWGWVAFGPTNEINWTKTMNRKQRRLAVLWAFINKLQTNGVCVVDGYKIDKISTKSAYTLLKNLSFDNNKNIIMSSDYDITLNKSFRNIENLRYMSVDYMNVVDLLRFKNLIIIGKDWVNKIVEKFTEK